MKKLLLTACFASLFSAQAVFAEVAVIVNPANGSAVDQTSASRIYLGKMKSFDNGTAVSPVSQAEGSAVTQEFNDKVLKKSASQLKAYWSKLVFTGKGTPPKALANDAAVIAHVASTPGGIGYVDAGAVDGSVKVVAKF